MPVEVERPRRPPPSRPGLVWPSRRTVIGARCLPPPVAGWQATRRSRASCCGARANSEKVACHGLAGNSAPWQATPPSRRPVPRPTCVDTYVYVNLATLRALVRSGIRRPIVCQPASPVNEKAPWRLCRAAGRRRLLPGSRFGQPSSGSKPRARRKKLKARGGSATV